MAKEKKGGTVAVVTALAEPVAQELGVQLWDVRYEKEGSQWYLRVFVDKEDGTLNIDDCVEVSRRLDKLLDEADPIDQSYILEVSSPGTERELRTEEHFQRYLGELVNVRLIRPVETPQGQLRDFLGELTAADGEEITILLEDEETQMVFKLHETAFVKLYDDYGIGGIGDE